MAKIFAVNAGSSSLKFKIYEMPQETVICSGLVERIGYDNAVNTIKDANGVKVLVQELPILDHVQAVKAALDGLFTKGFIKSLDEIKGVGHRIVQGGKYFADSTLLDDKVYKIISDLRNLAPLHNQAALLGIDAFKKELPEVPMVTVFDTAFHQTMLPEDYAFAIPNEYAKKYDIRRYGAHGTSHKYLAEKALKYIDKKEDVKIISCHLGSGASLCAIKDGKCVATSMGLTPLGGIMMGTRTGDMDPSVFWYLCKVLNKTPDEIYDMLNKKSGFLGVSGISNDARDVLTAMDKGSEDALLAHKLFIRRVVDYIGSYFLRLGGCDAIIFSAGIGENDDRYRADISKELEAALGCKLDLEKNRGLRGIERDLTGKDSNIKMLCIPTDEEVMIARDTYRIGKVK